MKPTLTYAEAVAAGLACSDAHLFSPKSRRLYAALWADYFRRHPRGPFGPRKGAQ